MVQKIVIYGCGRVGKVAYELLKETYEIVFFVDRNACMEECHYQGIPVKDPKELLEHKELKIVIAVMNRFQEEILGDLSKLGIDNQNIYLFNSNVERIWLGTQELERQLDERTIDLGEFFARQNFELKCKELTFITGGSQTLDYMFLKVVATVSGAKEYLEVGTYIGESINVLTDCCDKLYSVTAAPGTEYSMRNWCKCNRLPDYSERLTYNEKIVHYYGDSKCFDFSKHAQTVDLYFVDGDHSYEGVLCDTKNIFKNKKRDAIVVWHDFKIARNQYNMEVVKAVKDALGEEFKNVYVTNNNICGIYIPPERSEEFGFLLRTRQYEENVPLYIYDIRLENIRNV